MADDVLITVGTLFRKGTVIVSGGAGSGSTSFDEAFPNGCDGVFLTNTNNAVFGWVSSKSASGFTVNCTAATASDFDYLAVGH